MQKRLPAALWSSIIFAAFLFPWGDAWPAPEPQVSLESSQPAYASSLSFDLRPQVERASFHLRQPDLQTLYQAIANAYSIRLLFDRDLPGPRVSSNFDLENATLQEALEAAGSISNTFVAPLDEHTGIVVADTPQKRGEYERQVMVSLHADSQTTPQQLTEISTALRTLLDLRRVTQDTRSNWITIMGRTRQVAAAERFFQTLQKPPGEVALEIEVWEINSRRARELGVLPPQPFQARFLGQPQLLQQLLLEAQTTGGLSGFTVGKGRTLYGVSIPTVTAQASFLSSIIRSHQTMQLRASQGQQATLQIGQRFPVVISTVAPSFVAQGPQQQEGSLAFFPTIQYEDLGVVAKVTPYLHAGQELTLQLDVAVRDLGNVGANNLPTIINRQITGQVRIQEGESYLITGLRNNNEQRSVSGYPWFARIPLLGLLFGRSKKQQEESEFWLLIRPHILRPAPAEEFASRAIFFGKELTGLPPAPVVPLPTPAGQPPGPPTGGAPGVVPGVPVPVVPQPGVVPAEPEAQPGAVPAVPLPGVPVVPAPGTIPVPDVIPVPGAIQTVPGEPQPPTTPQPLPEPGTQPTQPPL
ncbi:MAG: type II and III secretion system protein [Acidobacteria bacterium]|nr:type II and III secretion system protein [Acidobacteriota bacterium]